MDIRKLYEKIQSQIKDYSFTLNKRTTDVEAFDCLCSTFKLEEILLRDVSCSLEKEKLEISGEFDISSIYTELHMRMMIQSDGRIGVEFSVQSLYLDAAEIFCANHCMVKVTLCENGNDFDEEISGDLEFGGVMFRVTAKRNDDFSRTQMMFQTEEKIEVTTFLNAVLSLQGVDLYALGIDKTKSFEVNSFSFLYTAPSGWLTADEQRKDSFDDYFKLAIGTDIGFSFRDLLGFSNLGFAIEKYGSEYDVMLNGALKLFGSHISFVLCYGDELFSISASQCEQAKLSNVEEMGSLVGEKGILDYFPNSLKPGNSLQLNAMNLMVASDFKSIQKFDIVVLLGIQWELCASPQIKVSNLLISFGYTPFEKRFGIAGDICFCGVNTQLGAGLVIREGAEKKEWVFGWRMYENETISLSNLITKLAEAFGIQGMFVRLPEIEISHVAVQYVSGTFSVQVQIMVTNSKLFSSETKIHITSMIKEGKRGYSADFSWKSLKGELTIDDVLTECGVKEGIADVPAFIRNIGLSSVELAYDFVQNKMTADIDIAEIGKFSLQILFGPDGSYKVIFLPQITTLSFADLPVVGGLVKKYLPDMDSFGVSNIKLEFRSLADEQEKIPAGLRLSFLSMEKERVCQLYERENVKLQSSIHSTSSDAYKIVWIDVNKSMAVFTLHRLGIGLDDSHFVVLLDASLAVTPLTFSLMGAGLGIDFRNLSDLRFYISGFSVAFKNSLLSIAGGFEKNGENYIGMLLIHVKQVTVNAIAEYSKEGALMAYAVVSANFGGPPVFFVTGVAFGFGYNKKLILPAIENVADYPLITAAKGDMDQGAMVKALDSYIVTEKGQRFLAAGIRFTSFGIIDSIAILTISFGKIFEVGLLGLSDVTMPPHCNKNPIAHAQLALKVAVLPEKGFVSVEARLTSESYILSKDCKLTGGFAFYYWFGGEHGGDMVITLGGYRADYQRPEHYPDVPRVGFDWNIDKHLNVNGEMYFALTPREVMAGGRLSAVYTLGKLKAYFIAAVDFFMGWKPFHYSASISIVAGVSYRVDFLFVHRTFTVELGAGLSIWGPEFTGTAHISWFIISFDISFGGNASKTPNPVIWSEFVDSFLPQKKTEHAANESSQAAPLSISILEGVLSKEPITICRSDELQLQVESAIPITSLSVNEFVKADIGQVDISVDPMGNASLINHLQIEIVDESNAHINVKTAFVKQNLPAALWGPKNYSDTLVKDVICGVLIIPEAIGYILFPVKNVISLEQLYINGTIKITDAFADQKIMDYPVYSEEKSIERLAATINEQKIREKRKALLHSMGLELAEEISLEKLSSNAENLFMENMMIKVG